MTSDTHNVRTEEWLREDHWHHILQDGRLSKSITRLWQMYDLTRNKNCEQFSFLARWHLDNGGNALEKPKCLASRMLVPYHHKVNYYVFVNCIFVSPMNLASIYLSVNLFIYFSIYLFALQQSVADECMWWHMEVTVGILLKDQHQFLVQPQCRLLKDYWNCGLLKVICAWSLETRWTWTNKVKSEGGVRIKICMEVVP